jgi:hypothetical protein
MCGVRAGQSLRGEQTLHRYIFVYIFPVDADTPTDKTPILSLLFGSFQQAGEPGKGRREFPAVRKANMQGIFADRHLDCKGINLYR